MIFTEWCSFVFEDGTVTAMKLKVPVMNMSHLCTYYMLSFLLCVVLSDSRWKTFIYIYTFFILILSDSSQRTKLKIVLVQIFTRDLFEKKDFF